MEHRQSAKMHCAERIRTRLNRKPIKRDIDKMRMALLKNNDDCFIKYDYPDAITGIVKYQNRWTSATYNKKLGVVITVGGGL